MIFRTKKTANEILQNEIILENRIYIVRIYNRKCKIKRCFKCYKYEHFSFRCINKQCCDRCSFVHVTSMKKNFHNECNKKITIDASHATKRILHEINHVQCVRKKYNELK